MGAVRRRPRVRASRSSTARSSTWHCRRSATTSAPARAASSGSSTATSSASRRCCCSAAASVTSSGGRRSSSAASWRSPWPRWCAGWPPPRVRSSRPGSCRARAAAFLVPGSLAIISATFHPDDRSRAVGAWSGLAGVASAHRPVRRRLPHRRGVVAADLLHQRPPRRRRRVARSATCPRPATHGPVDPTSRAR